MDNIIQMVNEHHEAMLNIERNKEIRKWTDERRSELQAAEKEEKAAKAIADFILPRYCCRDREHFDAAIGVALIAIASIVLSAIEIYYAVCGYDSAFTCGMGALMGVLGAGTLLAELKFGK